MAVDLRDLVRGTLTYSRREIALDDVRFERIREGFAAHYIVRPYGTTRFEFERSEGYQRTSRFDAFAMVDSGSVERVRDGSAVEVEPEGNIIPFGPRFGWLRFSLNIRSILIIWLLLVLFGAFAAGGDWLYWLISLVVIWTLTIVTVQRSLSAKMSEWLARESWN